MLERTRDHSHVEVLLREGLITEAEVHGHPMRNYVECCLGGDAALPEMSISTRRRLKSGDVLLLCTDGLWANLEDQDLVRFAQTAGKPLRESLTDSELRRSPRPLPTATTPARRRCAGGRHERAAERARARRASRAVLHPGLHRACGGLRARGFRGDARALHGQHRGWRAFLSARLRTGLGHRGVRHATQSDPHALGPRGRARSRSADAPRRFSASSAARCAPWSIEGAGRAYGHARLRRTAGGRRHAHRLDHRRLRGAWRLPSTAAEASHLAGTPFTARWPPSPWASYRAARPDLDYAEDSRPRPT